VKRQDSGRCGRDDLRDPLMRHASDSGDLAQAHPVPCGSTDRLVASLFSAREHRGDALICLDPRDEEVVRDAHLLGELVDFGEPEGGLQVPSSGGAGALALRLVVGDLAGRAGHAGVQRGEVGLALVVGEGEGADELFHVSSVLDTAPVGQGSGSNVAGCSVDAERIPRRPDAPILLDLCCKAGGAAMGYHRAGFQVVGVDIEPQPNYPFPFIQDDALAILRRSSGRPFGWADAIHASFPCQSKTAYRRKGHGVGDGYPDLVPEGRDLLERTGLPYVIENVEGFRDELRDPITLCGSSFRLDVRRHRLFECNFPVMAPPCAHGWQTPRFAQATNRANLRSTVEVGVWRIPLEVQQRAMGIDWMTLPELSEAIPPAYTEHIGGYLLAALEARHAA
jgi:DNA (cytosine-5)-methyltransferase 1